MPAKPTRKTAAPTLKPARLAKPTKPKSPTPKNLPAKVSVKDVLAALDDATRADAKALATLMQRISGHKPKVCNVSTLGFDTYHYKYESGREGDCHALGFNARAGKFTIYLMDGTSRHEQSLATLGKHTISKACLYFKRLGDLDLAVLEKILAQSYTHIKALDGTMHRAE